MRLKEFVALAKSRTYASGGDEAGEKLPFGGKRFIFKLGTRRYQDEYYGFNPFIGMEFVSDRGKAVWGMGYYGWGFEGRKVEPKGAYRFLQEALRKVPKDLPFRGPGLYSRGHWTYTNNISGNFEKFSGIEKIYFKNELVYVLYYFGGKIR